MATLKILAWFYLVVVSGICNATTTIEATSGTLNRLIGSRADEFDVELGMRDNAVFGVSNKSSLGPVLFGIPENNQNSLNPDALIDNRPWGIVGTLPSGTPVLSREIKSHVPEPDAWAIILLGFGFVIYQVRPRKARKMPNIAID
jgi:hypothetical protein